MENSYKEEMKGSTFEQPGNAGETIIMVSGDVLGNFKILFSKVEKMMKKSTLKKCKYLFCVGEFFGSNSTEVNDLKSGKIKVPVQTYILGANNPEYEKYYDWIDSVPNITYLGKTGYLSLSSGLEIAYLSGVEKSVKGAEAPSSNVYFSEKDVNHMISMLDRRSVIDILFTSPWPAGITKNVPSLGVNAAKISRHMSPLISKLAKAVKPRYHFCGLADVYYERIPYRNQQESSSETSAIVTKLYGLGYVEVVSQRKFVQAFKITPACFQDSKKLFSIEGLTTDCPYGTTGTQYFFDSVDGASSSGTAHTKRRADDRPQPHKRQALESSACWFCLASNKGDRDLIIRVGKLSYIALCKGGLVPEHVLIIPIDHIPSSIKVPLDVKKEMNDFKLLLVDYFEKRNLDMILYERSYFSDHMCLQVVPIPKGKKNAVIAEMELKADSYDVSFIHISDSAVLKESVEPDEHFFYIEIYIDQERKRYLCRLDKGKKLPLHFGRILLAHHSLLNLEERISWKSCENREAEYATVKKFKKALNVSM